MQISYFSFICGLLLVCSVPLYAQDTALPPPTLEGDTTIQTGESGSGFDDVMAQANQAYQAMQNRQFQQALALYRNAAQSNPQYQKMVDFVNIYWTGCRKSWTSR